MMRDVRDRARRAAALMYGAWLEEYFQASDTRAGWDQGWGCDLRVCVPLDMPPRDPAWDEYRDVGRAELTALYDLGGRPVPGGVLFLCFPERWLDPAEIARLPAVLRATVLPARWVRIDVISQSRAFVDQTPPTSRTVYRRASGAAPWASLGTPGKERT